MSISKKSFKGLTLILAAVVFFQSCVAYKSQPVSLEESYLSGSKSKVVSNSNREVKFKKIVKEEGLYYGITKKNGEIQKTPIDSEKIKGVKIKDKTLSTVLTIALPITIIAGAALIFQDSFKWKDSDVELTF